MDLLTAWTAVLDPKPSRRLIFSRFSDTDASALADILSDSSVTRNITSNGSTPERCLSSAQKRISWHNSTWHLGYGVWALRARDSELAPTDRLLGWCGFVEPDGDSDDPEILYALHRDYRGLGLAGEAAGHCIDWLFEQTDYQGVTAIIFSRLNPGSVRVVEKLGMRAAGTMPFSVFISDADLADDVVDYEIWRLACDPDGNFDHLLEQTAFRAGQLSRVTSVSTEQILGSLCNSLHRRGTNPNRHRERLQNAFEKGREQAYMDCYHLSRDNWQ